MGNAEDDTLPTDFHVEGVNQGMSYDGNPSPQDGKNFDKTTEEGLWRSILYSAKNVNPQANERFINLFNLGKKTYEANPQKLLDLMRHMFGMGFGSDAFDLYMNSRGQYVGDLSSSGQPTSGGFGGGNGMNPLMLMMMMGGGGNMSQLLPLMLHGGQGGIGQGGGQMNDMMSMMMMQEFKKQNEKKEQQERFDR
jgi:hypothetical protein